MNLDKYIEESKKNNSLLMVLIDGDIVVHFPISKSMLESESGLGVILKSLKMMMYGRSGGKLKRYKCKKCGEVFEALSSCNAKCIKCGYKHKCDEAIEV